MCGVELSDAAEKGPPGSIDVVADGKPGGGCGGDGRVAKFDIVASAAYMHPELRKYVSDQEYESVLEECNAIIADADKKANR